MTFVISMFYQYDIGSSFIVFIVFVGGMYMYEVSVFVVWDRNKYRVFTRDF